MGIEFRRRDYRAEQEAHSLPRLPAELHPFSAPSPSHRQIDIVHNEGNGFIDPLRRLDEKIDVSGEDLEGMEVNSEAEPSGEASELPEKEWLSFSKTLMQKFPVSKVISVSSISSTIIKSGKANEKSTVNVHLEELDDPQKFIEEGVKVISQQDYVSRLQELKEEITRAWSSDDRVTSLKKAIKVSRLLMDTSVEQFYPKLFLLTINVLDMLGDLVWQRIRQKSRCAEDGTFSLPDNFKESDISFEAKETCNNWFSKVGSIRELLPRIYLELAILPCWRFLLDSPTHILQRLVMMTRGIGDPLASAYCRLYIVHRAQKLPQLDTGYLITCINDFKTILANMVSTKETKHGDVSGSYRLLLGLIEPTIEYIMKCIFKGSDQTQVAEILVGLGLGKNQTVLFGQCTCVSIVLHHLLKELPIEVICCNAVDIFLLIECSNDSSFDQCLNYQLLGFRLCERLSKVNELKVVTEKVIQVVSRYRSMDEYLKIIDAYLDIILETGGFLNLLLDGIFERCCDYEMADRELASLQSILLKVLTHFDNLEDVLSLNHFVDILDAMQGSSRNVINMHILNMATRNFCIRDPAIIQILSEVAQALHDGIDFSKIRSDENQQAARLVSRFISMVDYGPKIEENLAFLVECRGALGSFVELKENLVHSSNHLAVKAMKNGDARINFVKSCLAFSEVTIPSVPDQIKQLNLYLETAEVALMSGLISHPDELIDSAISCLENIDRVDGLRDSSCLDVTSSICKLWSLMIVVPGNLKQRVTCVPKRILSIISSETWVSPRIKISVLCALILFSAALCQDLLPYTVIHGEVGGNHNLFFREPTYIQDLLSVSDVIMRNIVAVVLQEPSQAARGRLALEACNCIASSFTASSETSAICSKLVETAKSSLSTDDKYLASTLKFLDSLQSAG